MDRVLRYIVELAQDTGFRKWQNSLADKAYATLAEGYREGANEVSLVERLRGALKEQKFEYCQVHAEKIHGNRSLVTFDICGQKTTKELGDSVFISLLTRGASVKLMKLAIVQNKKESNASGGRWKIDLDQLHLLSSFPTFDGNRGIINQMHQEEVVFLNPTGKLGNYGLFASPGEMYLADAKTVRCALDGKTVTLQRLHGAPGSLCPQGQFAYIDPVVLEDLFHFWYKRLSCNYFLHFFNSLNADRVLNLLDTIRGLTLIQIGETIKADDQILDSHLFRFAKTLLRQSTCEWDINFDKDKSGGDPDKESHEIDVRGMTLFAVRHDLPE